MGHADEAVRSFSDGDSCSQAVFSAFAPLMGVDAADALALASGFGGGMHIGGTCGAATGAVLVLGVRYFDPDPDGAGRRAVMSAVETFHGRFAERMGAMDCPSILGCDIRSPEGRSTVREQGLRESVCAPAVRTAAEILEEMLDAEA